MKEKLIIEQLNTVKPDAEWKKQNREIIMSQIYHTNEDSQAKIGFFGYANFIFGRNTMHIMAKPAFTVMAIILLAATGGIASLRAARETTPGDSLYIAKIISEKTQMALTFDEKSKTQLNVQFAANRAEELQKVMEKNLAEEEKQETVAQLKQNLKKEIQSAKAGIEKIGQTKTTETGDGDSEGDGNLTEDVFSVDSGKTDDGMQISDDSETNSSETVGKSEDSPEVNFPDSGSSASSSPEVQSDVDENGAPERILAEAQDLIEQENYGEALDKLNQVEDSIDEEGDEADENKEVEAETSGKEEVKGVTESASETTTASSTDEE